MPPNTLSATVAPGRKITVGIAEIAVSAEPGATLVTYALGSCIGVTVYDPVTRIGGMLHFMLPSAALNEDKAGRSPGMFGDTGVPLLFRQCYDLGAQRDRLVVCAAGGAEVLNEDGHFKIGSRNRTMLRKLFWKNNILIAAEDTGGSISRTLSLDLDDGRVSVRNKGTERALWPE